MSGPIHTYGSTCLRSAGTEDLPTLKSSPVPPRVRAQFLYTSSLPIDDPLAPLPAPSSGSSTTQTKSTLPFSERDNIALEEAWRALREARDAGISRRAYRQVEQLRRTSRRTARGTASQVEISDGKLSLDRRQIAPDQGSPWHDSSSCPSEQISRSPKPHCNTDDERNCSNEMPIMSLPKEHTSLLRVECETKHDTEDDSIRQRKRHCSQFSSGSWTAEHGNSSSPGDEQSNPGDVAINNGAKIRRAITKGPPFESRPQSSHSADSTGPISESPSRDAPKFAIPVGVSRLHLVKLPNLKMEPIYWSPLHDISDVQRATWFYKNTMLPVDPILANKLEGGYVYMRPWTETWQDELNSCVENGADAEIKIVHKLWEKETPKSACRPNVERGLRVNESIPGEVTGCDEGDVAILTFHENFAASVGSDESEIKPFRNSSVVYVDATNAQILRPSLLPSGSRGRRPLSSIRKGRQIGIPVVRGFNRQIWDKLHVSKQPHFDMRHYIMRPQTGNVVARHGEQICYACAIEESRPSPSDLVLVIHGIGQKLSERMESFHFTHAINGFRRSVNMELNNEDIWPHIRRDHGGIMVLPVNWRSTLSLEETHADAVSSEDPTTNHYTLKDITPDTIPAIRNLVSDVILDIPYYLSHHKQKMIQAVVKEANRVYRLWCKNNPGFHENGRVHLLAHSLGSVMAIDILSHQPTRLPEIDFATAKIHEDFFEFDTKNLFLCGSPAGLFLFLNKGNILPRRGRDKPGRKGEYWQPGVAGDVGTYGCLAIDNLYNIMHTTDPIAYRLNAAVDSDLAESLKIAFIPSLSTSFLGSFSSVFRLGSAHTHTSSNALSTSLTSSRLTMVSKLPSNVELETHDFTREEIADKRMLLLNDNGQVDFCLSGGGGPLNIQYLNMLSAHSSYWILPDFIRFFVVEISRRQDKDGVLPALRAEKKKGWKAVRQ